MKAHAMATRVNFYRLTLVATLLTLVTYFGWTWTYGFSKAYNQTISDNLVFQTKQKPKLWNPQLNPYQTLYDDVSRHYEELKKLGDVVQRRLQYIQNPKSCNKARTVKCRIHGVCGFGCQINTVSMCLIIGYATNRTVVSTPPLTSLIKPLSKTCTVRIGKTTKRFGPDHEEYQQVAFRIINRKIYKPDFFPPAVPADLADGLSRLHGDPFLWWVSQFTNYLLRPTDDTLQFLQNAKGKLRFSSPIVGVHVRRTDKLRKEAKLHRVEEYMVLADEWFDQIEQVKPSIQRKIFLATDDPTVKPEILAKYPQYEVLNNEMFTTEASTGKGRKSEEGYRGIIHDVYFLGKCDFLVCTFTSNICRLAYQMMQVNRGNSTGNVISVDIPWVFYGQRDINRTTNNGPLSAKMPVYDGI